MTLGQVLSQLIEVAKEDPEAMNRPIMIDDGDEVLGALSAIEKGYSSRKDDLSGIKLEKESNQEKYPVIRLIS